MWLACQPCLLAMFISMFVLQDVISVGTLCSILHPQSGVKLVGEGIMWLLDLHRSHTSQGVESEIEEMSEDGCNT